jgi:hypothetical protein
MTNFTLPPFVVDWDGRWVDVDMRGDLREWAQGTTRDVPDRWKTTYQFRHIELQRRLAARRQ